MVDMNMCPFNDVGSKPNVTDLRSGVPFLGEHTKGNPLLLHRSGLLRKFVNPFTAKCGQRQISTKVSNFIFANKWHHVKVQEGSFHLNGHIIGFRP